MAKKLSCILCFLVNVSLLHDTRYALPTICERNIYFRMLLRNPRYQKTYHSKLVKLLFIRPHSLTNHILVYVAFHRKKQLHHISYQDLGIFGMIKQTQQHKPHIRVVAIMNATVLFYTLSLEPCTWSACTTHTLKQWSQTLIFLRFFFCGSLY